MADKLLDFRGRFLGVMGCGFWFVIRVVTGLVVGSRAEGNPFFA